MRVRVRVYVCIYVWTQFPEMRSGIHRTNITKPAILIRRIQRINPTHWGWLLTTDNLNRKVEDLVTYLNCVNKDNKTGITKSIFFLPVPRNVLIPVAERSKAWVYGRSLEGTAGSNSAGIMAVSCEYFVFSCRGLCDGPIPRPEASFRDKERQRASVYVECDQIK